MKNITVLVHVPADQSPSAFGTPNRYHAKIPKKNQRGYNKNHKEIKKMAIFIFFQQAIKLFGKKCYIQFR
jgi:hypothetical protein